MRKGTMKPMPASGRKRLLPLLLSFVAIVTALTALVAHTPEASAANVSITEVGIKRNSVVWYYKDGHSHAYGESLYFKGGDGKEYYCVEPDRNFRRGTFSSCGSIFKSEVEKKFALALYWAKQNISGDQKYTVGQIIAWRVTRDAGYASNSIVRTWKSAGYDSDAAYTKFKKWYDAEKGKYDYTAKYYSNGASQRVATFTVTRKTGSIKIVKSSTTPALTNGHYAYKLANAKFGVFTDKACKNRYKTMTTGVLGTATLKNIPTGDYWIKEETAPSLYAISSTAAVKVTVTGGKTVSANFTDKPDVVSVKLVKQSSDSSYGTTGSYALTGAVYGLWENRWGITNGADGKAGTKDDVLWGVNSSSSDLTGVYEITTATGYAYTIDAYNNGKTAGTKVCLWPGNSTEAARWRLIKAKGQASNSYYIENVTSGLRIGTAGKKTAVSTPVCLVKASNSDKTQIWDISATSPSGTYAFKNHGNTKVALEVPGGTPESALQLRISRVTGTKTQAWKLRKTFIGKATANAKGEMTFSNLIPGHTYYAREISGPTSGGYEMNYAVIAVKVGTVGKTAVTVTTKDHPIPKSPTVSIGTKANVGGKKTLPVPASGNVTVTDVVSYTFTLPKGAKLPSKQFTVKGTLMDKATKKAFKANGKDVTATATFTPTAATGTCSLSFTFPASALGDGKTLVAYEELWGRMLSTETADKKVAEHKVIGDTNQTVEFTEPGKTTVEISTSATASGKRAYAIPEGAETVTIKDVVTYNFTMTGGADLPRNTTFTINGTLMDKATKSAFKAGGESITATDTFKPSSASGTRTLEFVVPVSSITETTSLVVYEEMTGRLDDDTADRKVAEHKNINDSKQTVKLTRTVKPELSIRTVATVDGRHDASTESRTGDTVTIVDKVLYEFDLNSAPLPQRKFRIRGILMDKTTGEKLTHDGQPIEAQAEFTPESTTGETQVTFSVPKDAVEGKHIVVFETVYDSLSDGLDASAEDDLSNMDQTVSFPVIGTTATDSGTDSHQAIAFPGMTAEIDDVIRYDGLTPRNTYQVVGTLHYKDTGEPVKVDGNDVTVSKTFKPSASSGTVTVTFSVPVELLENRTVVVFERLLSGETEVAAHADINDANQSVSYTKPEDVEISIGTKARDAVTGSHSGTAAGETSTIEDEVSYTGLTPGSTYWLVGTLMDKETGKPLTAGEKDEPVTSSARFVPSAESGTTTVEFVVPSESLSGKFVVVFERLYKTDPSDDGATPIAVHEDIDAGEQAVSYPFVRTHAKDKVTGDHDGLIQGDTVTIVDEVICTGLIVDKEYTISGTIYDKATGQPLGATTPGESPQDEEGIDEAETGDDQDPNAPTDATEGDNEGDGEPTEGGDAPSDNSDGDEGNALVPADEPQDPITATKTFTATAASMTVTIEFTAPSSLVAGKSVVAFESLSSDGNEIAVHANLDDADQTVNYPYIGTCATDSATSDHDGDASADTIVVDDLVTYAGLVPGTTYTLTGTLMDKATGKPIPDASATTEFVANGSSGTATISIPASGQSVLGKAVVAFEKVMLGEKTIAVHEDISDNDQTVSYPSVSTTALYKETGQKDAPKQSGVTEITDRVEYKGLTPGVKYTIVGTLHDKAYEKALYEQHDKAEEEEAIENELGFQLDAGGKVIQEFSPSYPDGHIDISFAIDIAKAANKDLVVFEVISRKDADGNDQTVVTHEDLDAESQTVHGPIPETGTKPGRNNTNDLASDLLATGSLEGAIAIASGIAAISGAAFAITRKARE